MNLATKLTLARIVLIPIFIIVYYLGQVGMIISAFVFIIAALTDFLDGYIARKFDQVTTLGAFLDPLADKVLTMAAFILLCASNTIPPWSVILILGRETLVNGLRFIAAEKNIVISASLLGKIKTMTQMIAISLLLLSPLHITLYYIGIVVYWIAVVATVVSGIEYTYQSRRLFKS